MHVGAGATGEENEPTLGALDGSNIPATPERIVERKVALKMEL